MQHDTSIVSLGFKYLSPTANNRFNVFIVK